jgi:hypothetical protein
MKSVTHTHTQTHTLNETKSVRFTAQVHVSIRARDFAAIGKDIAQAAANACLDCSSVQNFASNEFPGYKVRPHMRFLCLKLQNNYVPIYKIIHDLIIICL